jgi:dCTP deaminase
MLLPDHEIAAEVAAGHVRIDPWDPALVQPASLDVRLGREFRVFESHHVTAINPARDQPGLTRRVVPADDDAFVLHPHELVLACTREAVTLPAGIAARLEGKSSLGRLGLQAHATAGWIDPGFTGQVTLELSNVTTLPVMLWPGMSIGQLCFFRLSSPAQRPYGAPGLGSRYQGQQGAVASRSHEGFLAGAA